MTAPHGGCGGRPDSGRAGVYAAEEAALGGTDLDSEVSSATLRARAREVLDGSWWAAAGGPPATIRDARSAARHSSARLAGHRVVVSLAPGQRNLLSLAHELGHALAGVAHGHDARFRAAHLDVIALLAGDPARRRLAAAYASFGLPPARRSWPPPARAVGDGFLVVP